MPPRVCDVNKIDSNVVGILYAKEECRGLLPSVSQDEPYDEDGAIWKPIEVNSYDDWGGEIETVVRRPISSSRQDQKGVVSDLSAEGGVEVDLTQNNVTELMQGFLFADAHEPPTNKPFSELAAATTAVIDFVATGSIINVESGGGAAFKVGMILRSSGFVIEGNNQNEMVIASIATDALTVTATLTDETYTVGKLEVVGYEFGAGDATMNYNPGAGLLSLDDVGGDWTALFNLQVGQWIFVGGNQASERFPNNEPGYARLKSITASTLTLIEPTWLSLTAEGTTSETLRIYFGVFIRNEKDAMKVKTFSWQFERTLGQDADGIQSEYLVGAVANEFTLNFESADKATCDLSFQALDADQRTGAEGLKTGDRATVLTRENAFNTADNVFQIRMFVHDATNVHPNSLFGFVLDGTIEINNNVVPAKAVGTLGAFDLNVGNFEVGGELNVYFSTILATRAVRNNADVGLNMIIAKDNAGQVYDVPLMAPGGGRVEVEQDEPIMIPLETSGAENINGYTMSVSYFAYLPTIGMGT